jgi:hypothetical protein
LQHFRFGYLVHANWLKRPVSKPQRQHTQLTTKLSSELCPVSTGLCRPASWCQEEEPHHRALLLVFEWPVQGEQYHHAYSLQCNHSHCEDQQNHQRFIANKFHNIIFFSELIFLSRLRFVF